MDTRELDARVAREVMGFEVRNGFVRGAYAIGHYSEDMNAAMEVVAALEKRDWYLSLDELEGSCRWDAEFWSGDDKSSGGHVADTAPLAICLAALEAVAGKDKE